MKSTLKKLAIVSAFTATVGLGTLSGITNAQADDKITASMGKSFANALSIGIANIANLLTIYLKETSKQYETVLAQVTTQNAKQTAPENQTVITDTATDLTSDFLFNALTATPEKPLSKPTRISPGFFASKVPYSATGKNTQENLSYFNVATLLGKTKLDNIADQGKANAFIQIAADAGNATRQMDPGTIDKNKSTPQAIEYLNALGTYNAQTSQAISVLYRDLAMRKPVDNLGNESQLSYDEKQALRRMSSQWTTALADLATADLLRESVLIQAESRYEAFQLRMQLEELNATLAMLLLTQQQTMSKSIVLSKQQLFMQSATNTQ